MRNLLLTTVAALAIALFATPAFSATTATASWTQPMTRTDGSPMAESEIAGYELAYSVNAGSQIIETIPAGSVTKVVTLNLTPRVADYTLTVLVRVVDVFGLTSVWSTPVTKTFQVRPSSNPSAPTEIKFSLECSGGSCTVIER